MSGCDNVGVSSKLGSKPAFAKAWSRSLVSVNCKNTKSKKKDTQTKTHNNKTTTKTIKRNEIKSEDRHDNKIMSSHPIGGLYWFCFGVQLISYANPIPNPMHYLSLLLVSLNHASNLEYGGDGRGENMASSKCDICEEIKCCRIPPPHPIYFLLLFAFFHPHT